MHFVPGRERWCLYKLSLKKPNILFTLGCTEILQIDIVTQQTNLCLQVIPHFSTASILSRYQLKRTSSKHLIYLTALSVPHEFYWLVFSTREELPQFLKFEIFNYSFLFFSDACGEFQHFRGLLPYLTVASNGGDR